MEGPVSRSAECPSCHRDLRCCKNCVHYAPGSHYDCHETVEELVVDKEKSNFCDSFSLRKQFGGNSQDFFAQKSEKAQKAKAAFDSLFS